jgi:hypothetical protein
MKDALGLRRFEAGFQRRWVVQIAGPATQLVQSFEPFCPWSCAEKNVNFVPVGEQTARDMRPDEASGTGDEDAAHARRLSEQGDASKNSPGVTCPIDEAFGGLKRFIP